MEKSCKPYQQSGSILNSAVFTTGAEEEINAVRFQYNNCKGNNKVRSNSFNQTLNSHGGQQQKSQYKEHEILHQGKDFTN